MLGTAEFFQPSQPILLDSLFQRTAELLKPVDDIEDRRFALADLRIRTKEKSIIPFAPNKVQIRYLDTLLPRWREGEYHLSGRRDILLKARQFGFSTLILALFFLDTVNNPNTQTVVIAHDADSTERLFQIVRRFYDHLPEATRPKTRYANRKELLWPGLDSSFFVGTAGAKGFGRGGTINNVHMSEGAFWPDAETLVAGLLQAVPADGNVFAETTANGLGNWFYTEYQTAKRGASVFTPRFFAWHEHEEYRVKTPALERTEEEEVAVDAFGLDDEQLAWRRGKIRELKELFPQEYPANDDEAFLTSGNPYFDRQRLQDLIAALQSAEFDPIAAVIPEKFTRLRNAYQQGRLKVWEVPVAGRTYAIGADTAEGLTDEGERDFDSAETGDRATRVQVAHLHGLWETREYGLALAELGFWYNTALLGVERNNHGHAVINALIYEAGYPLMGTVPGGGGLYVHEDYDQTTKMRSRKPGWPTNTKTKPIMLDGLAASLTDGSYHPRSRQTLSEMMTFIRKPGGKAGGEGKSHDDCVVSSAILDQMFKVSAVTTQAYAAPSVVYTGASLELPSAVTPGAIRQDSDGLLIAPRSQPKSRRLF